MAKEEVTEEPKEEKEVKVDKTKGWAKRIANAEKKAKAAARK